MALIHLNFLHPPSMANSAKASLVPDVGGGPNTSIFMAGKAALTSFQVLCGFGMSLPSPAGISFANARNISFRVSSNFSDFLELAKTIPS